MNLINKDYSYNFLSFKGPSGEWHLTSSESSYIGNISDTIDTFSNRKGNYVSMIRSKIASLADSGYITPLKNTEVIGPSSFNSRNKN